MTTATLIAHRGGKIRTRAELATLDTPDATDTWRPVPHHDLVEAMIEGLQSSGAEVVREQYATSGQGDARLFGVLDLKIPVLDTPDYGMMIGIRGSNDKSMALQAVAGARVFVCDNMAFSGDGGTVVLKKKHTSRLDLGKVIPPAIDAYLDKAGAFKVSIERMRETEIGDGKAKELIYDAFARHPVMPPRLFREIGRLYFDDDEQREKFEGRTIWSLSNAFTEVVKALKPVPQENAALKVGRYFGRVMGRMHRNAAPIAGDVELLD